MWLRVTLYTLMPPSRYLFELAILPEHGLTHLIVAQSLHFLQTVFHQKITLGVSGEISIVVTSKKFSTNIIPIAQIVNKWIFASSLPKTGLISKRMSEKYSIRTTIFDIWKDNWYFWSLNLQLIRGSRLL